MKILIYGKQVSSFLVLKIRDAPEIWRNFAANSYVKLGVESFDHFSFPLFDSGTTYFFLS